MMMHGSHFGCCSSCPHAPSISVGPQLRGPVELTNDVEERYLVGRCIDGSLNQGRTGKYVVYQATVGSGVQPFRK